jgi:hypothetical protein
MLTINENIKKLPKRDLKKWIKECEKTKDSPDWKEALAELKEQMDVSGTGTKSKKD